MIRSSAACLLVTVWVLTGCRATTGTALTAPTVVPASRPATAPASRPTTVPASRPAIPVVYVYPDVARVSAEQMQTLLEAAAKPAHAGRRIWFIAAHQNRGQYYRIILYFTPDQSSARCRQGQSLQLWWWTGDWPSRRPYVQVSRPQQPFRSALETPAVADLPYEFWPASDNPDFQPAETDYVAAIDLARPALEERYRAAERLPPYQITFFKSGRWCLATGTDEGGDVVGLKKSPKGFEIEWRAAPWSGSPF